MLQQMRKAQGWMIKGVLWAVVLAFVVTIFYSWGVQSSSGPARSEVATILGEPVSIREFQRVQNALYQTYRGFFRNQPEIDLQERFNFREMALEQIARRHLLERMARQNGIVVTDAELYDRIAAIPTFQEQGRFNTALYQTVLQNQVPPIAPKQFEEEQRRELMLEKIYTLVRSGIQVTATELEQAYQLEISSVITRPTKRPIVSLNSASSVTSPSPHSVFNQPQMCPNKILPNIMPIIRRCFSVRSRCTPATCL
jgi:peptidyl-prolyl cis-trans isomerase D